MYEVVQSDVFREWLRTLKDARAPARVYARLAMAELGNLGDWKPLRDGISEMRIDTGPGYRLYFTRRGHTLIVLLCGGDKRTQSADIKRAAALAKIWRA
jgi:putative addiction module killer protein